MNSAVLICVLGLTISLGCASVHHPEANRDVASATQSTSQKLPLKLVSFSSKGDPCEMPEDEFERTKNTSEMKSKLSEVNRICDFSNFSVSPGDEKTFLSKWGKEVCADFKDQNTSHKILCRHHNLVVSGSLSIAESIAVAGYTGGYYSDLTPEAKRFSPDEKALFNRLILSGINKLSQLPEYQYNSTTYRGTSLYGAHYSVGQGPFQFNRWISSSCVQEIAFGPVLLERTAAEKKAIEAKERAEGGYGPDEDIPGLEYSFSYRDPKSVPKSMTSCQKKYFDENPKPPMTPESNFANGDLKITFLPAKSASRRVAIYKLSTREQEAEILFPSDTYFRVKSVEGPDSPKGDGVTTLLTLEEVSADGK